MTTEERDEVKELLHDILSGYYARTESQFNIINLKLENIGKQTTKTNNRTTKNEEDIQTLTDKNRDLIESFKIHSIKCPLTDRLEILEKLNFQKIGIVNFIKLVLGTSVTVLTIISLLLLLYTAIYV